MTTPGVKILKPGDPMPENFLPLLDVQTTEGRIDIAGTAMSNGLAGSPNMREANILSAVSRGLPTVERKAPHGRHMVLVGYGPSLLDTWEGIAEAAQDPNVDIFTTSGANAFLAERCVPVDFHLEIDPRARKMECLGAVDRATQFLLASRCHPSMFDALSDCQVAVFHLAVDDELALLNRVAPGSTLVPTAITAGVSGLQLGLFFGYRRFTGFGLDCSFRCDESALALAVPGQPVPAAVVDSIARHAGKHPSGDTDVVVMEVAGKRLFATNMLLMAAVNDFFAIATQYPVGTFRLAGDGMLQFIERESRRAA